METSVAEQFTAYIKNILLIQQIEKKPDTCCFFSWMAIKGSITLHFREHQIQARPRAPLLISLTIPNSSQFRPITVEPRLTNTLVRRTPRLNERFCPVPIIFPVKLTALLGTPLQTNNPSWTNTEAWSRRCSLKWGSTVHNIVNMHCFCPGNCQKNVLKTLL